MFSLSLSWQKNPIRPVFDDGSPKNFFPEQTATWNLKAGIWNLKLPQLADLFQPVNVEDTDFPAINGNDFFSGKSG